MNVSHPFIKRPIGTTLVAIGLFLAGAVCLPEGTVWAAELPTIKVSVTHPTTDPEAMAAAIAAPIERRLSEIAGVSLITTASTRGTSRITIQFEPGHDLDSARRDVQEKLESALADLPGVSIILQPAE